MPENLRRCTSCDVLQLHPCGKDNDEERYFGPMFRSSVEMGPDHDGLTVLFHLHA